MPTTEELAIDAVALQAGFVTDRFFATGDLTRLTLASMVALAVLAVVADPAWRQVRYLVTTIHELGHVVVGWFVGRSVHSVHLSADTSGLTTTRGRSSGPGLILLYLAGYPAPAVAGFLILWAVIYRHAGWAMTLLILLLALCLALVRNLFGAGLLLLQIAVLAAIWVWNEPQVLAAVLVLVGSLLCLGGLRACIDLVGSQRRRRSTTSDAAILGRHSRLGATFWCYAFTLVALGLLAVTAWMVYAQSATLS